MKKKLSFEDKRGEVSMKKSTAFIVFISIGIVVKVFEYLFLPDTIFIFISTSLFVLALGYGLGIVTKNMKKNKEK